MVKEINYLCKVDVDRFKELKKVTGITMNDIVMKTGVARTHISRVIHGEQITKQTINSILLPIANLLEIDVKELIVINPNLIKLNSTDQLIKQVEQWSKDKGLDNGNSFTQYAKSSEEMGEVAAALCRNDIGELRDGIGDVIVTLVILAQQNGMTLYECLEQAYGEIKDRKGVMSKDGSFIKESDIKG